MNDNDKTFHNSILGPVKTSNAMAMDKGESEMIKEERETGGLSDQDKAREAAVPMSVYGLSHIEGLRNSVPQDYATSEDRVPRAERRDEPDASVLVCITMFGIFGMALGALITWLVMS